MDADGNREEAGKELQVDHLLGAQQREHILADTSLKIYFGLKQVSLSRGWIDGGQTGAFPAWRRSVSIPAHRFIFPSPEKVANGSGFTGSGIFVYKKTPNFLHQSSSKRCIIVWNYVWILAIHWLCLPPGCANECRTPRGIRDQNTHTWVCRTKSAKCWSLAHNSIILRRSWISCGKRSDRGRRVYATHGHKWLVLDWRRG